VVESERAFLYAEFEIPAALGKGAWQAANPAVHTVPGLRSRTLLSGIGTDVAGGFYEFDTVEHARAYAESVLSDFARSFGGKITLRLFSGDALAEASRSTASPYFGN
jgi:hypothetical protein